MIAVSELKQSFLIVIIVPQLLNEMIGVEQVNLCSQLFLVLVGTLQAQVAISF